MFYVYPAEPDPRGEIKQFMSHKGYKRGDRKRWCEESNLISPDHETGMLPLHYTTYNCSLLVNRIGVALGG